MNKTTEGESVDWQSELRLTTFKYHVLIAWVAILLNPVFAITDYFNSPSHFVVFAIFRAIVTLLIFIVWAMKLKLKFHPEIIALVPFVLISVQNAYMYSVMNVDEFHRHTLAYVTLFVGAGMFVLWSPMFSVIVVAITFVSNIILFWLNSPLTLSQILVSGGLLTACVALFTILLIYTRTNLTKKEIIARLALANSNMKLEIQNELIEEKNKNISDSINYAKRIQHAIFPPTEKIKNIVTDYFILFRPKDIVSGDFYWFSQNTVTEIISIAAVDCTGHGVPGALMSIIGSTILNQSTSEKDIVTPANSLNYLNKQLANNLNEIQDGMDMSFCNIDQNRIELQYAGANNPIYIVRNKELIEIKADKMAIGGDHENYSKKTFTNHKISLQKNDCIYLFTDGYADQFGGPEGKKFKYKSFQNLLLEFHNSEMEDQQHILNYHFEQWKGDLEQVDDVLVIGIRIK